MREEVHVEPAVTAHRPFWGRFSWGAVFAGVFVTLVIGVILTLLGVGIGAGTIDPLSEEEPLRNLGIGTLVWLGLTGIISSFFGAWVAGRCSENQRKGDGAIHGLVTWGVTTICMGLLATTTLGSLLGGAATLFGRTVSAAAQGAASQGGENAMNLEGIKREVVERFPQAQGVLSPTGQTPEQSATNLITQVQQNPELLAALTRMVASGGSAAEREQAINLIASKQNVSREEATKVVDDWNRKFQQAKAQTEQKAREAGDVAARGVSRAALGSCFMLLLFGVAAVLGGRLGETSAIRNARPRAEPVA